jgi:putative endonuclease
MTTAASPWFVYLLECASGSIYTGATPDVPRRLLAHQSGRGARYTRMDPPKRLLAAQQYAGKREALQAEAAIKRLSAANKRQLAQDWAAASLLVGGGLVGSEEVAERVGFEPTVVSLPRRFSRPVP